MSLDTAIIKSNPRKMKKINGLLKYTEKMIPNKITNATCPLGKDFRSDSDIK